MSSEPRKRPQCARCGKCCRAPVILITKPSDYRRWVSQGRTDILGYATEPPYRGYGDLWMSMDGRETSGYCPFARKADDGTFSCAIQDTKPKVCKEFWCEWAYGVGKKEIPFKTDRGWTDRAVQLGYGKARH